MLCSNRVSLALPSYSDASFMYTLDNHVPLYHTVASVFVEHDLSSLVFHVGHVAFVHCLADSFVYTHVFGLQFMLP